MRWLIPPFAQYFTQTNTTHAQRPLLKRLTYHRVTAVLAARELRLPQIFLEKRSSPSTKSTIATPDSFPPAVNQKKAMIGTALWGPRCHSLLPFFTRNQTINAQLSSPCTQ